VKSGSYSRPIPKGEGNKEEAYEAFYRLMALEGRTPAKHVTLGELCVRFREFSKGEHAESTAEWYRGHLQSLIDFKDYIKRKASELTPSEISAWIKSRKIGQSTRRGAITAVKSLYSWGATNCGLPPDHPIRRMERPPMKRRRPLTAEEIEAIFAAVPDRAFRDFLTALQQTGARPAEIARVTAQEVHGDVWVLGEHKTAKRTGKERVIYLNEVMVELTRERVQLFPEGPIFRQHRGKRPWNRNAIRCRFKRLRQKLGLEAGVVCYGLRHAFVTDALERGVPIATLAEIVGHADTKMISAVYSHLHERREHLRKAVEQATGLKGGEGTGS
jgi:integrase